MLYIHIPYCRKKCFYCDFFSGGSRIAEWDAYLKAVVNELTERIDELPQKVDTIYIGGGTPSLIPYEYFGTFTDSLRTTLLNGGKEISDELEFSLEVNPEDVDNRNIKQWKNSGVNRISVGIQTFNDIILNKIGRNHNSEAAHNALDKISASFDNFSGDLIFGLPEQTEQVLKNDIELLLSYAPKHISIYSLMFEDGSAITEMREQGRFKEADDNIVTDQYKLISGMLSNAGFEHYEISNYALPGYLSKHNSGYWSGKPYLGLGPSAHSFNGDNLRRANPADIRGYIKRFNSQNNSNSKFYLEERLDNREKEEESIMLSLRTESGINLTRFKSDFGAKRLEKLLIKAKPLISNGLLIIDKDSLKLTSKGIMISDYLIVELF